MSQDVVEAASKEKEVLCCKSKPGVQLFGLLLLLDVVRLD